MNDDYLERFLAAYIECALWASTDDDGENLERDFQVDNIAPEALAEMRADCADFIERANMERRENWTAARAGHDFWLTRNGHGTGFWDRGEPDGGELTDRAHDAGPCDLYVGDDGKVYVS